MVTTTKSPSLTPRESTFRVTCGGTMRMQNCLSHLLLVLLLLLGAVQTCSREERCPGGRPFTPNGCCPGGAGEACGEEVGVQCDTELGYSCVDTEGNVTAQRGTCRGRYNLHVTDTGTNTVSLEWEGFLPADYYFEYVLLFRTDTYSENTTLWTQWDIGTQPQYTVTKLQPGTLYFMRLALWVDARATVLGHLSETIWVVTDSVTHCSHNGQVYQVGEVVDNCEDQCTCTATGRMHCTPTCLQSSMPEVPEGCSLEFEDECSCNVTVRCPEGDEVALAMASESCEYKGDHYADGATWMDMTNCTTCACEAGHVICQVTCQEPEVPEGCVNPRHRTEEHSCCPIIVCDNTESVEGEEECRHNGSTYQVGSSFTLDCALCVCGPGGLLNCSSTSCPMLELPVANILCPDPHVRRDGCCDTVFCVEENPDPQALLSRLMALSFEPNTLTISFDVDHVTSSETVTQERYEVMTSDGQEGASSWTSRTYTPTTLDADDNVSSPSDLLHADSAIRVDERVYITLDGLRPNTTYYVRVEPVIKRDMGGRGSEFNSSLTGFFVARTMEIDTKCVVGEVTYQNGDVISDDCEEVCKCVSGDVICQRTCPEEQLVMTPSVTCPRPQLVLSEHSCCKTWRCFPEDNGCFYKNIILKPGEQVYEGSCGQRCKCTKGEVTCTPVCPPVSPAPRSECILTNVTNTCCPVWMCPQETKPAVGMFLAGHIGFHGPCLNNDTWKTLLRTAFENRIEGHLPCADRESEFFIGCWFRDVMVACPYVDVHRKRRQTPQLELVIVITANITESNTESKILASFNQTESALSAMFSASISLFLGNGVNVTSYGQLHYLDIGHLCSDRFLYRQNVCVPDYLYRPPGLPLYQNVSMTVGTISPHAVTLTWPALSRRWLSYVTALVIEFRVTSSSEWTRTVVLDPVTTNHTLTNLSASHSYAARLVAFTISASSEIVSLPPVHFTTANHEVLTSALTFNPLHVSLGMTSVTLTWQTLPSDVIKAIHSLQVTYGHSQKLDEGQTRDLDPHESSVTLTGLEAGKVYVSKFVVSLVNGTTVTLTSLHFVTKTAETSEVPVVPLLATCAVLVLLSVLIPIVFFVWRRMRRKSGPETAFENKTYGVNISSLCTTRAKNDCARPQETEDGSAVASSRGVSACPQQA